MLLYYHCAKHWVLFVQSNVYFLWYNYINLFFFYYLFVCHKYYKYIMQIDHIPLPSLCITIIHSCCCYVKFSNYTVSYYNQHFFFFNLYYCIINFGEYFNESTLDQSKVVVIHHVDKIYIPRFWSWLCMHELTRAHTHNVAVCTKSRIWYCSFTGCHMQDRFSMHTSIPASAWKTCTGKGCVKKKSCFEHNHG